MLTSFASLDEVAAYHLLTQTVVPRPIAWVLSVHPTTGLLNLAPFSFFAPIASAPPILAFSIGNRLGGREKDTGVNAQLGAPMVIHIPSRKQLDAVNESALPLPPHQSELAGAAMSSALDDAWDFPLPRVADAPVAFACTVTQRIELAAQPGDQTLVLAQAALVWCSDEASGVDVRGRTRIDPAKLDTLSRLGAGRFGGVEPL